MERDNRTSRDKKGQPEAALGRGFGLRYFAGHHIESLNKALLAALLTRKPTYPVKFIGACFAELNDALVAPVPWNAFLEIAEGVDASPAFVGMKPEPERVAGGATHTDDSAHPGVVMERAIELSINVQAYNEYLSQELAEVQDAITGVKLQVINQTVNIRLKRGM